MGMETSSLFFLPGTSPQTFLKQADTVSVTIYPVARSFFFALGLGTAVLGARALPANVAISAAGKSWWYPQKQAVRGHGGLPLRP